MIKRIPIIKPQPKPENIQPKPNIFRMGDLAFPVVKQGQRLAPVGTGNEYLVQGYTSKLYAAAQVVSFGTANSVLDRRYILKSLHVQAKHFFGASNISLPCSVEFIFASTNTSIVNGMPFASGLDGGLIGPISNQLQLYWPPGSSQMEFDLELPPGAIIGISANVYPANNTGFTVGDGAQIYCTYRFKVIS